MGPERLIRGAVELVLVCGLAGLSLDCGAPPKAASPSTVKAVRHVQIVPALTTKERRALVERFRARNPANPGSWVVNEDALEASIFVVDPFKGFVRRASRNRPPPPSMDARAPLSADDAAEKARAFVKKNTDLLGLTPAVVIGLMEDAKPEGGAWVVHFEARFPSKGYEAFPELENNANIEVTVDNDGEVSALVNRSQIHPSLFIDVRPELARDDQRVVARLVGRKLFALTGDLEGEGGVSVLHRIPLGEIHAEDVTQVVLGIHLSPGPRLAWLTYRLAYAVAVDKRAADPSEALPLPPSFYFFRYIVDADTGDVLEDTRVPIAPSPFPPTP